MQDSFKRTVLSIATVVVIAAIITNLSGAGRQMPDAGKGADSAATHANGKTLSAGSGNLDLRNIVKTKIDGTLIEHKGYTLMYDKDYSTPCWVAWELTSGESQANTVSRKGYDFIPDDDLPYQYQIVSDDYRHSGYDRGHMCPAGDMKWDADAMHDCFYMTNICPQVPVLNQRWWEHLESSCRRWAVTERAIYVVCGPIYQTATPTHIGREHMIAVPDAFYKVVISLNAGREKGIGFYYTNSEDRQTMESAARTIDRIEELTGYDFFPELADTLESRIEAMNSLRAWK